MPEIKMLSATKYFEMIGVIKMLESELSAFKKWGPNDVDVRGHSGNNVGIVHPANVRHLTAIIGNAHDELVKIRRGD